MLQDIVHYAIIGHSERRIYFHENLDTIRDKVAAAVRNGITPILCVGESQTERNAGETKRVIHDQLVTAISNLTSAEIENMVIAYEPVWAISTFGGILAKPDDIKKLWIIFVTKLVSYMARKHRKQFELSMVEALTTISPEVILRLMAATVY